MSEIRVSSSVNFRNDLIARQNRTAFKAAGLSVINMISSPGAGKTSILERMAQHYGPSLAVITGDIQMTFDADRINRAGAVAHQIETGGSCHLTAAMIANALASVPLTGKKLLVIENVGNLVCPAAFDLGEDFKVALLSVAEGDEKPAKYPALFTRARAVIINKIDLLPYVKFDAARAEGDCRKLNNAVKVLRVSCTTGEGLEEWFAFCDAEKSESRERQPSME